MGRLCRRFVPAVEIRVRAAGVRCRATQRGCPGRRRPSLRHGSMTSSSPVTRTARRSAALPYDLRQAHYRIHRDSGALEPGQEVKTRPSCCADEGRAPSALAGQSEPEHDGVAVDFHAVHGGFGSPVEDAAIPCVATAGLAMIHAFRSVWSRAIHPRRVVPCATGRPGHCPGSRAQADQETMTVIPGQPCGPQSCGSRFAPRLDSQAWARPETEYKSWLLPHMG